MVFCPVICSPDPQPMHTDETNIVNKIVYGNQRVAFVPVDDISQEKMLANLSRDETDAAALEAAVSAGREDNRILTDYLHTLASKE